MPRLSGHWRTFLLAGLCLAGLGSAAARADITAPCHSVSPDVADFASQFGDAGWQAVTDTSLQDHAVRQAVSVFGVFRERPALDTEASLQAFRSWVDDNLAELSGTFLNDAAIFSRGDETALLSLVHDQPGHREIMCIFMAPQMPDADRMLADRWAVWPDYLITGIFPLEVDGVLSGRVEWTKLTAPPEAGLPSYAAIVNAIFRAEASQ